MQIGLKGANLRFSKSRIKNFGSHVFVVRFDIDASVYLMETTQKAAVVTLFGTVLTLTLSAVAGLKIAKQVTEVVADRQMIP